MVGHKRWFRVQSIGFVRRIAGQSEDGAVDPAAEATIEIDPRWAGDLAGIDEYSHLAVTAYLDQARRRRIGGKAVHPEGRLDIPAVGFMATRTPHRPNPISLHYPRLLRRDGSVLSVTGIDAWDGTPVLDIKGYSPRDEVRPGATVPAWLSELWQVHDRERGGPAGRGPEPGSVVTRLDTTRGEIVLRYPLPTDADAALAYINALSAERTFVLLQGVQLSIAQEEAWLGDRLARLADCTTLTIFATSGDQIIGTTETGIQAGVFSHVAGFGLGVAAEWRGVGLGRLLMKSVIDEAIKYLEGLRIIQLDVFANNERALSLYRSMGFTEYGRFPNAVLHRDQYVDLISMHRPVQSKHCI